MPATNYFRVSREVFPFVDTSPKDARRAYDLAVAEQVAHPRESRPAIVLFAVPKLAGSWSAFPLVGQERA